ncbi:hypothetical protein THRCLA_11600 [Thraustotheca clavata]|uniref:Zinc finger PHD-type domain-containing protein n=1 Tax=Thraustotheca clavata TaxID=74557 RepID=A0A1V9Y778_9STRA|nr:hypothetical protein THRCLA_11600 [Thraustotheca clavata]
MIPKGIPKRERALPVHPSSIKKEEKKKKEEEDVVPRDLTPIKKKLDFEERRLSIVLETPEKDEALSPLSYLQRTMFSFENERDISSNSSENINQDTSKKVVPLNAVERTSLTPQKSTEMTRKAMEKSTLLPQKAVEKSTEMTKKAMEKTRLIVPEKQEKKSTRMGKEAVEKSAELVQKTLEKNTLRPEKFGEKSTSMTQDAMKNSAEMGLKAVEESVKMTQERIEMVENHAEKYGTEWNQDKQKRMETPRRSTRLATRGSEIKKQTIPVLQTYLEECYEQKQPNVSNTIAALCWKTLQHLYATKVLPKTMSLAFYSLFTTWIACEQLNYHSIDSIQKQRRITFQAFDQSTLDIQYIQEPETPSRVYSLCEKYQTMYTQLARLTKAQEKLLLSVLHSISSNDVLYEQVYQRFSKRMNISSGIKYFIALINTPEMILEKLALLSGSLIRHYLRIAFVCFDASLGDDHILPNVSMPKELYQHQDLGAAIHRALFDKLDQVRDPEDKYYAAVRIDFLFRAFQALVRFKSDPTIQQAIAHMQILASRLVLYNLEDEKHLFVLQNIDELLDHLQNERNALKSTLKKPPSKLSIDLTPPLPAKPEKESTPLKERPCPGCFECKKPFQDDANIECRTCLHRYHLACVFLSPTYRDYSRRYVCYHCI